MQDQAHGAVSERKRKGGFARVFSAPFRGLAKLFSGGKARNEGLNGGGGGENKVAAGGLNAAAGKTLKGAGNDGVATPLTQKSAAAGGTGRTTHVGDQGATEFKSPSGDNAAASLERSGAGRWNPTVAGVSPDHLSQGRALLDRGHLDEAIAELSIAATVGPELLDANNLLGVAYSRRGRHKQAVECYERALTAAPEDAQTLANLGHTLYLAGRHESALKRLQQAAKRLPNSPHILHSIGLAQVSLGRFEDAYKSFTRAGGEFGARIKIAGILESVGRGKEAIKHYEEALRLQPNSSVALQNLANLYQRAGRFDKAEIVRRTLARPSGKGTIVNGGG